MTFLCRQLLLPAALLLGVAQAHAGLVLHYAFDETSGTSSANSAGGGHTGTLTNMSGTEWTTGITGGGLSFDGSNDYVAIPTAAHPTGSEVSVAFWSKGEVGLAKNYFLYSEAGGRALTVHLPYNGGVTWDVGNGGGSYDRISKSALASEVEGSWVHWAFTKNATTGFMNIYHNGSLWHSAGGKTMTLATSGNPISKFYIGAGGGMSHYFEGTIDDFRMYDHALSASEVSALVAMGGGAVPEPASVFASLGLLSAAGCGLREWRRRKKKAA
ncbi:MAG: hypothetical protein CMI26_05445 [Opitutae bacterium]|nr:hypothetical protein [Opitutae bacterium]